jgi:hypothetical protein
MYMSGWELIHHNCFSGCLDALLAWARIACQDLSHSRITIAESMDDQRCANRIPVPNLLTFRLSSIY